MFVEFLQNDISIKMWQKITLRMTVLIRNFQSSSNISLKQELLLIIFTYY